MVSFSNCSYSSYFCLQLFNQKKDQSKEAWADIDVQLKRRYDLVPNLVESVKGYMTHEEDVFQKVTEARTRAMEANGGEEKIRQRNQFGQTLKTLFAVAESILIKSKSRFY